MPLPTLIKNSIFIALIAFSFNAHALTVSPARVEVAGDPGQTISGEIDIYNEQVDGKTFYTSYENFVSSDDSGAPKFVGGADGLATWIDTVPNVAINPGQKQKVPFTIKIPANAEPGGYFAAVFFSNQPPVLQEGEVAVGGKIGVLMLLRVNGDIREGAGLVSFGTENSKRFYTSIPVKFQYKINNTGADRIVPVGDLKIKNSIRLTSEEIVLNEGRGSVLPNSTRKFDAYWRNEAETNDAEMAKALENRKGFWGNAKYQIKNFHFGWYTGKMNLSWGEGTEKVTQASFNFFVLPWQLLTIIILVVGIVGFIGKIALRKYNQLIIAKASTNQSRD